MGKKIRVICKTKVFDSVRDAAKHFGICSSYITKIAKRVKYKDVYGRTYKTIREIAEILGVSRGVIQYRLKKGLPRG